tara:strand:- start:7725 stop:8306 length:582 start_codon:yes stop_codon:yes gene_type:complete
MAKKLEFGCVIGRGKRGVVWRGKYGKLDCAIKVINPKSETIGRIRNEGIWLKKLNCYGIGPKFYYSDDKILAMEFLEGVHLSEFLRTCRDKNIIKRIMKNIFLKCRIMDKLNVNKYEMHHVGKNAIVVSRNKPVLIDFERCRSTEDPKNVTQFCQFMMRHELGRNRRKIFSTLKSYKKNMTERNFRDLVELFF